MKRLLMILLVLALLTGCAPAANPYGPEDFAYDGDYLTCTAGESRLGVDVSSHQGDIDWNAVAAAGVEFAMVRVGFRGYAEGEINEDTKARTNIEGAKAAGLDVGVYFFSQAISPRKRRRRPDGPSNFWQDTNWSCPWSTTGSMCGTRKRGRRIWWIPNC